MSEHDEHSSDVGQGKDYPGRDNRSISRPTASGAPNTSFQHPDGAGSPAIGPAGVVALRPDRPRSWHCRPVSRSGFRGWSRTRAQP